MGLGRLLQAKSKEVCTVHGGGARAVNRTLIGMILACLALIVWHVWTFGPSGHAAGMAGRGGALPVQVLGEIRDLTFGKHGVMAELWDVLPYFLVGIFLAGYLRTYKVAVKLQASLRRYGALSVVVASFVGIITPLCACGTLTTAISLLFAGLPLAPVMAILVTSPLMSPSTYLLTLNDLGPEWTVIRTVAAFLMGIFAGYVTHFLCKRGFDKGGVFIDGGIVRGDFHDEDYPDERLRCNCRERFGNRVAVRTGNKFLIFLAKSAEMLWAVGKYVIVGVTIGAIVERYMPYEWIYRFFGRQDPLNILWVALGSVPIFLHQISASSIMVHIKNSLHGTLDGGAGLAFMIGGPVTAIPTLVLFWTLFKKRFFFLYLAVCLTGTILIAVAFQQLIFMPGVDTGNHLLRGVTTLPGGRSTTIEKQNQQVRAILDPTGQNIVATYSNDVAGHGGIVFDGSFERFMLPETLKGDNARYVGNAAAWLEQGNFSLEKGTILLYLADGGTATTLPKFINDIAQLLRQAGFAVTVASQRDMPALTDQRIAAHGQLWLFVAEGGHDHCFSPREVELLTSRVEDGKSMLLAVAPRGAGAGEPVLANQIATRFGARFTGTAENSREISVAVGSRFFASAAEMLGKMLKIVHKA